MGSSFKLQLKVKTRKMNAFVAVLLLAVAVSANDRIIGGGDASSTSQAPFQVSLQSGGSHFCGASLISTTHVMSAGHCKITGAIARTTVAMEGLQYNTLAQKYAVASWEVHPDFVQGIIINYDYSVITLTSAVTLKAGVVETIALPAEGQEFTGMGTISGWGKIAGDNGVLPINLQIVDVPLMEDAACGAVWGTFRITPQSQCVGLGGTGSCNGDSGGPLWQEVNGVNYLIGNTSWGSSTCDADVYPTIYSKNSAVIPWIQAQM